MILSLNCRPLTISNRLRYVDFSQMENLINSSFEYEEERIKMMHYYGEEGKILELSSDESTLEELSSEFSTLLDIPPKRKGSSVYFVLGKPGSGILKTEILILRKRNSMQQPCF